MHFISLPFSSRSDACDVLVLMLSHDSSMKHVYSAQNGALLQVEFMPNRIDP